MYNPLTWRISPLLLRTSRVLYVSARHPGFLHQGIYPGVFSELVVQLTRGFYRF